MIMYDACIITTIHPPFEARIWARGVLPLLEAGLSVKLISGWKVRGDPAGTRRFSSARIRPPRTRGDRLVYTIRLFLVTAACRARIYHFHDLDFLPFGVLLRILTRSHVIYDCHENYHLQIRHDKRWIPRYLRSGLAYATEMVERWSARILRTCIVPLPEMVERFRIRGVTVVCVQNRTAWSPARSMRHRPDIVYSGTIGANYGMHILLGIARELKRKGLGLRIYITLKNALDEDRNTLCALIAKEGLPIVVHDQVTADRIGELLSLGTVGLSLEQDTPEKRRAIPGKLFEYMAFGLPVVTSDVPTNREIVEQAGCGIVVPSSDAEAYVDAVQQLMGDPELLRRLQENGFRAIETVYSWAPEKSRLIELYSALLRRPLRGG
jgi:glycosyltransferase involved in cell wall biosynthesis